MRIGSFCTGYGGLDLATERVFGGHTVWTSDIDKGACKIIEARFPGIPNIGDLKVQDWDAIAPVDIITAGYPCQPFSQAGLRGGTDDPRHIWPFILHAVGVLRPRYVVLENVRGHLTLGGKEVVQGLASIGYDSEWSVVRASDVGACHQRARLFIVAGTSDPGVPGLEGADAGGQQAGECGPGGHGEGTAPDALRHGYGDGGEACGPQDQEPHHGVGAYHVPLGSDGAGWEGGGDDTELDWGEYEPAIRRHESVLGRPAPHPTDDRGRLNPVFVEWMMMLPEGWVTDALPARTAALKALGNGVVPAQAEHALRGLLERT